MKGFQDGMSAIGPLRTEVRGYSCGPESVVQQGFYDDVVNVKFGQGREANVSHVRERFALQPYELLRRPNRIRESCPRHRVFRVALARTHAMLEVRNCQILEMTKDSPSSGFSRMRSSHQSLSILLACLLSLRHPARMYSIVAHFLKWHKARLSRFFRDNLSRFFANP